MVVGGGWQRVAEAVKAVKTAKTVDALWHRGLDRFTDTVGGPARRRVVLLLAAVLALESADAGTVGAVAAQLERTFRIGNTELGLLITVSSLVGAFGALPMGVLADRGRRVRVLAATALLWAVAMVASGLSTSYLMLLLTRLALGAVTAAAGPFTASLTGDFFPAKERSRVYGMILTGELLGAGVGLVLSADISEFAGWRAPFFALAVPSAALAYALHRFLPEPARGGQSWLAPGDEEVKGEADVASSSPDGGRAAQNAGRPGDGGGDMPLLDDQVRQEARRRRDVEPRPGLVLKESPDHMSPWRAGAYILRIPSNLVLIGSSVLGYFFLAGLRSFAVLFAEAHYGVSKAVVTLVVIPIGAAAVAGTLGGGRLVDHLVRRGVTDSRVLVAGIAFVATALAFAPGLASADLVVSVPLYMVGAALLTVPNPALDAGRLDVVPSKLWGRGEAVRTFARSVLEAFGPLAFGYISSLWGGPAASFGSGVGTSGPKAHAVSVAESQGLEYTFMVMLVPLMAAGALLLVSRHAYLRDVATADLSDRRSYEGRTLN